MKTIKIYGASDDLIEIDGDIREEFNHYNEDDPFYLAFSDGTALSINYNNDGFWRINRLAIGSAEYSKHEGMYEDGDYSDIVTLKGDIKWAVGGKNFAK
jgi:hypothetical protein